MNRNIGTVAALGVSARLGAIQRMFHIRRLPVFYAKPEYCQISFFVT